MGLGKQRGRSLYFALQMDGERGWTDREHPATDPTFLSRQRPGNIFPRDQRFLVCDQVPADAEGSVAQLLPW